MIKHMTARFVAQENAGGDGVSVWQTALPKVAKNIEQAQGQHDRRYDGPDLYILGSLVRVGAAALEEHRRYPGMLLP